MSSGRVARSEALLAAISRKAGISEDGKQWLVAALDPFHDNPIKCNGFPDNRSEASVVQCIKQSVQISVPAGVTTGTWDCHITAYPWLEQTNTGINASFSYGGASQYSLPNVPTLDTGGMVNTLNTGGIGIFSGQTGENYGSTGGSYVDLSVPNTYLTGAVRCIATGFEVTNTTSPLNVQGLCTVWRSPVSDFTDTNMAVIGVNISSTTGAGGVANIWLNNGPPANIGQALLLADSKQWHAKEGAYVVPTLANTNLSLQYDLGLIPVLTNPLYPPYVPTFGQTQISPVPALVVNNGNRVSGSVYEIYPGVNTYTNFNLSGSIFTGLSLQTTLTLTWHVYIERFPGFNAGDLIVLATPSPLYDPQALELYSSVVQHMPPGVMVKENGLGDWFQSAIGFAKDVISPVLSVIPHPIAQVANAALKGVSGVNDAIKNRQGNTEASVPRPMIKAAAEKKKPAVRTNRAQELRIAAAKKKMGK